MYIKKTYKDHKYILNIHFRKYSKFRFQRISTILVRIII